MIEFGAVDVGKRRCITCVMDEDGSILDSGSYPNTTFDASHCARQTAEKCGESKVVVESTGNMCMKTHEAFESNCVEVKLANPVKTRAIAEAREACPSSHQDSHLLSNWSGTHLVDRHLIENRPGIETIDSLRDQKSRDSRFRAAPLQGGHSVVAVPPAFIPV